MREQILPEPLTVPDLSVRITIIALQTRFCPIENPVVSVSYLFYT